MDGARLSRFPHLAWLPLQVECSAGNGPFIYHFQHVVHLIHKARKAGHAVRWITQGNERRWDGHESTVHLVPATGEACTVVIAAKDEYNGTVFGVPEGHFQTVAITEDLKPCSSLQEVFSHDDAILQSCMDKLMSPALPKSGSDDLRKDEVARRLVLRLFELSGAGTPDWHDDASVFDARTLLGLTDYIDEHLGITPSLSDMALLVGMSPSHFARKFRHSTGLSFGRFVNRRRIWRSFEILRTDSPLASVALDLGFSSQSHFTRLFSGLTGMTPAKYRKRFRRTVG